MNLREKRRKQALPGHGEDNPRSRVQASQGTTKAAESNPQRTDPAERWQIDRTGDQVQRRVGLIETNISTVRKRSGRVDAGHEEQAYGQETEKHDAWNGARGGLGFLT